jgi:hypothetical protein
MRPHARPQRGGGLAVTKLATPTPVLREMVNEIKNSNDIKYQKDNAK